MTEERIDTKTLSKEPGKRPIDQPDHDPKGYIIRQFADCEVVEGGQLKVARHRHFEFFCDEPATLGGNDTHPQPLTYICAGVGF